MMRALAEQAVARCLELAQCTEEPGRITRTFLSPPMRRVHELVGQWMREAGLDVSTDAVGNIRGVRGSADHRLIIGSHLDTVPNAGAYDGILGVMLGIALAGATSGPVAVIGFSEEEGVKFGVPFIGSRAVTRTVQPLLDADARIAESIRGYGLDTSRVDEALLPGAGYFEIHIEQGPVLENRGLPLAVVDAIGGLSRWEVTFTGAANHAGTTPMELRRDALVEAAKWILEVDRLARSTTGLVATVGRCEVKPGAGNVIPGRVTASLDVRHKNDAIRQAAVAELIHGLDATRMMEVDTVAMDPKMMDLLPVDFRMTSGAGHDAMIMAEVMPSAMLFLRSPGGISHHPDEAVLLDDVEAALQCAKTFVEAWHG